MDNKTFFKNMQNLQQLQEVENRKQLQDAYLKSETEKIDVAKKILKIEFGQDNTQIIMELKEWALSQKNKKI